VKQRGLIMPRRSKISEAAAASRVVRKVIRSLQRLYAGSPPDSAVARGEVTFKRGDGSAMPGDSK
jgi:hypothetical protein